MRSWRAEVGKYRLADPDIWFPAISAIVITVCLLLLYRDFTGVHGTAGSREIGRIFYKNRVAQRKYAAQVVWAELHQGSRVYNRDTIRTEDSSEAIIELKDGTRIELDQNSMIVLAMSAKVAEIKFRGGSIRTRRSESAKGEAAAVRIKVGDKTITAGKGADIKLSGKDTKKIVVTLKKGKAKIEVAGKKKELKKNQQANLSARTIVVKTLNLKLKSPFENQRYFVSGGRIPVRFTWNPIPGGKPVNFEMSSDSDFRRINGNRKIRGTGINMRLGPGVHYWRIRANSGRDASEVRTLRVIRRTPLRLFSPLNRERVEYLNTAPLVGFSWGKNEYASGYVLEIAKNSNFRGVIRIETSATGISRKMERGIYYWRVRSKGTHKGSSVLSSAYRLNIRKLRKQSAPRLLSPRRNAAINVLAFTEQGAMFNWLQNRELRRYDLGIARDVKFKNPIYAGTTTSNYFVLKRNLGPGRYYWRIRGTDTRGNHTDYSRVASFRIIRARKPELLYPIANRETDFKRNRDRGLSFGWRSAGYRGRYKVMIARSRDLSSAKISKSMAGNRFTTRELPPGSYYWQVRLLGKDNRELLKSDIARFSIVRAIGIPRLLYPIQGTVVDMSKRNALSFRWRKVEGAEGYVLKLYQVRGGRRIMSVRTDSNSYSFSRLDALDTGSFYWDVAAQYTRGNKKRSTRVRRGRFIIRHRTIVPPKIEF